jgi:hypothetical protein
MATETRKAESATSALRAGKPIDAVAVRCLLLEIVARDYDGNRSAMARRWGITKAYLSDVLNGRRGAGPAVLRMLGVRKVVTVTYARASARP